MRHAALLLVTLLLSTTAVVPAATAATAAPTPVETAPTTPDGLRDAPSGLERPHSPPTVDVSTRDAGTLGGPAGALAGRAVTRAGTTFTVSLRSDGDARWTVRARYRLSGPAERAAFARLAGDYEDGNATVGPDPTVWRRAAARAADATGRSMTVRAVDRRARLVNDSVGELRLGFEWTAFANRTGPRQFRVGDAFRTAGGSWLPRVGSNQTVILEAPPGSRVTDTGQYPLDDARIRVAGPQEFTEQPLTMAYTLAPPTTTTPPPENRSSTATSPTTASPVPPGDGDDTLLFGAALLAVVLAVVALIAYQGGLGGATVSPSDDDDGGPTTDTGGGSPPGAAADGTVENGSGVGGATSETDTEPTEHGGGPATGGSTAGGATAEGTTGQTVDDTTADDEETEDDEPDVELLSDEERVERLLERNGGRMRQADIVSETGWSDAKVSQLLSAMADEGRVDKLRLGRENLISFPDVDDTPGSGGED